MALFGQKHVERYIATEGREGHEWQGTHTLILTTTGRRSGQPRSHPLIYGRHGDARGEGRALADHDQPMADYDRYQSRTDRQIPVVVLEPDSPAHPST
jgi:hypothetical protein